MKDRFHIQLEARVKGFPGSLDVGHARVTDDPMALDLEHQEGHPHLVGERQRAKQKAGYRGRGSGEVWAVPKHKATLRIRQSDSWRSPGPRFLGDKGGSAEVAQKEPPMIKPREGDILKAQESAAQRRDLLSQMPLAGQAGSGLKTVPSPATQRARRPREAQSLSGGRGVGGSQTSRQEMSRRTQTAVLHKGDKQDSN